MEQTFADMPVSRTPHECTSNDVGRRWRNQAEASFKQRVVGSNPTRLTFPCGSGASALFRSPRPRRWFREQRVSGDRGDDAISVVPQGLKRILRSASRRAAP